MTPSASSLLALATHDAIASGTVHEVVATKSNGETLKMVNDIGSNGGRQVISLSDGSSTEVIAFDSSKRAYIKGNKIGLEHYFGFPLSSAVKYAGKWMAAVPSDTAWANITGSTTLTSDFETNLRILNPVLGTKLVVITGIRCYELSGKQAASANGPAASVNLYVSDTKTALPVRLNEVAKGEKATVTWSKWGNLLTLKAPTKSVPLP